MPKPYITLKIDTGEEVWLEPESLVPQGLDQRVLDGKRGGQFGPIQGCDVEWQSCQVV